MDITLPSGEPPHVGKPDAEGLEARVLLGEIRQQMFGRRERLTVGRFELQELLGRGAHGSVYLAIDAQLQRRVAVKLLQAEVEPSARARLLREAQALARLKHPNVLTVYDVGVEGERIFVAMEYAEVGTLADWCVEHPVGTRTRFFEVLRLAIDTAKGLAAAHDAGIVHRDIKPANILVGEDGRPRIADFGLARAVADSDARAPTRMATGRVATLATLSRTGEIVGTPAYMAPEQFEGRSDAASDQWSLCAAFWEAAYGVRPFPGHSVGELLSALDEPPRAPPTERGEVPQWFQEILTRGLSPDPGRRWPSVAALGAALEGATARRRRRRLTLAGLGSVVVGLGAAGAWQLDLSRRRARCAEQAGAITEVWSSDVATRLHDAIVGTELPFAETTVEHAVPYLDAYAESWQSRYDGLCVATEVDGTRAPKLWVASRRCLEKRRDELATLIEVLTDDPDVTTVRRTVGAAAGLGRLEPCSDDAVLRMFGHDEGDDDQTSQLRHELGRARALLAAGRYAEGRAVAETLLEPTVDHPSVRLRIEVRLVAAELSRADGALEAGRDLVGEAFDEALATGEHDLALRSATDLVWLVGSEMERHDEGLLWGRVAQGLVAYLGRTDDLLAASLHSNLGAVYDDAGRYDRAEREHQRALTIRDKLLGSEHPSVAVAYGNLGAVYFLQHRQAEAERMYKKALAIEQRTLGDEHPTVASTITNLGIAYRSQGRYAEAEEALEKALSIRMKALGPDHASVAEAHSTLGDLYYRQGRHADAARAHRRAVPVLERAFGPDHPKVGDVHNSLGLVHHAQGNYDEAQRELGEALRILAKSLGPDHSDVGLAHINVGNVHYTQGNLDDAHRSYDRAVDVFEKLDPEHPILASIHNNRGAVLQAQGRTDEAERAYAAALPIAEESQGPQGHRVVTALEGLADTRRELHRADEAARAAERLLEIREQTDADDVDVARARFLLARALWDAEGDRSRAHELAELARAAYEQAGREHADTLAEVERWLAARSPPP